MATRAANCRRIALGFVFALFLSIPGARAQGLEQLAGVWELNVTRSHFTPGTGMKAQTRVYEVKGREVKQTIDSIDNQGRAVHNSSTAVYDGKDHELDDNPDADTITVKQTGPLTGVTTLKKEGKVVQTVTRTLSADGKTLTFRYQGSNAKGMKIDNLLVFEKR
jgi:Na+-translocating ferredoxin:NAD+ oxidoreductase RnfG subunit